MKYIRKLSFMTVVFTALGLLFSLGAEHSLSNSLSTPLMHEEVTTHCQSVCSPLLNEKQKTSQTDEDDVDPVPLTFQSLESAYYTATIYAVALGVLALQFLRRRPPDLVLLYANYRV